MKKAKIIGITVMTAGLLMGCVDQMPELTEEQSALIAEYAADMLLKYSPNYDYKIVEEALLQEEETSEAAETQEVPSSTEEIETQIQVEIEAPEEASEESALNIVNAVDVDFAEVFQIDDVSIVYDSFVVCDSYPMEQGAGFSVEAPKGKQLLAVKLMIENNSEDNVACDLLEKDFEISVNVNGGNYRNALRTMLVNDFAAYMEEIPAGESREAVIVAATEETSEEDITSCILRLTSGTESITVELK